jgi:hypothetical protein
MAASAANIVRGTYNESLALLNEFKKAISHSTDITSQKSQDILQEFQDDFKLLLQLYVDMIGDTEYKYQSLKALKDSINQIDIEEPLFVRNNLNNNAAAPAAAAAAEPHHNTRRIQRHISNYFRPSRGRGPNAPPRPTKRKRDHRNAPRFNLIRQASAEANAREAVNLPRLQEEAVAAARRRAGEE